MVHIIDGGHFRRTQRDGFIPAPLSRRLDWSEGKYPSFCREMKVNPKPISRKCKFNRTTSKCQNESESVSLFSQFHQDYFLYSEHFKKMSRPGIYVDIASNDPIDISNSYFLDRCLGWSGLCVEANDNYFQPTFKERSCKIVPTCVGSEEGQIVRFSFLHGGMGGIVGSNYKSLKIFEQNSRAVQTKMLRCTTMKTVSEMHGITQIDYLSLDVEGNELEVLKGFGLEKIDISVMTIETNEKNLPTIDSFLRRYGYKRLSIPPQIINTYRSMSDYLVEDVVYIHRNVTFGSPI